MMRKFPLFSSSSDPEPSRVKIPDTRETSRPTDSKIWKRTPPVPGLVQQYSIRGKLLFGILMLVATIFALGSVGFFGFWRYKTLADAISTRATELPMATDLSQWAATARDSNSRICQMKSREGMIDSSVLAISDLKLERSHFDQAMLELDFALNRYGDTIGVTCSMSDSPISEHAQAIDSDNIATLLIDTNEQRASLVAIGYTIHEISRLRQDPRAHAIFHQNGCNELSGKLNQLCQLTNEHLDLIHGQLAQFSAHVRGVSNGVDDGTGIRLTNCYSAAPVCSPRAQGPASPIET